MPVILLLYFLASDLSGLNKNKWPSYILQVHIPSTVLLPMVVVSNLRRTNLPNELERIVFLLVSRKPHDLANCMWVARRVKVW